MDAVVTTIVGLFIFFIFYFFSRGMMYLWGIGIGNWKLSLSLLLSCSLALLLYLSSFFPPLTSYFPPPRAASLACLVSFRVGKVKSLVFFFPVRRLHAPGVRVQL